METEVCKDCPAGATHGQDRINITDTVVTHAFAKVSAVNSTLESVRLLVRSPAQYHRAAGPEQ